MFEYIKGSLVELSPAEAVVETHGVAFGLNISLSTYSAIQGKSEVCLYVYEAVREDAWVLYGFASKAERRMFLLLLSVSGVGANTARMILSSLSAAELQEVIALGNESQLKGIKGIGLKTAQRIIVDLKDKVLSVELSAPNQTPIYTTSPVLEEAVAALVTLGFAQPAARKAVQRLLENEPTLPSGDLVRQALKIL